MGDHPSETNTGKSSRCYTTKQMGDACEMLVAAELTLAGIPALKVPDCWPGYDVVAQPPGVPQALRVSVKSRTFKLGGDTFVSYQATDVFDWLAVVLLPGGGVEHRRIYLVPRGLADQWAKRDRPTSRNANERYWSQQKFALLFAAFEGNFSLCDDLAVTKS